MIGPKAYLVATAFSFLLVLFSFAAPASAVALPISTASASPSRTTAPASLILSARDNQNALSVLSNALKTFPHPAPTHKASKITQLPQPLKSQISNNEAGLAAARASSARVAKETAALGGIAGMLGGLAHMQCSTVQKGGYWTSEMVGGKTCRMVQHPCSQCTSAGECCVFGPAVDGFAACESLNSPCEQNWH